MPANEEPLRNQSQTRSQPAHFAWRHCADQTDFCFPMPAGPAEASPFAGPNWHVLSAVNCWPSHQMPARQPYPNEGACPPVQFKGVDAVCKGWLDNLFAYMSLPVPKSVHETATAVALAADHEKQDPTPLADELEPVAPEAQDECDGPDFPLLASGCNPGAAAPAQCRRSGRGAT